MKSNIKYTMLLTSEVEKSIKHEDGTRTAIKIVNTNGILDAIKKGLKHKNRVVFISTEPNNYIENDERLEFLNSSLKLSRLRFKELVVLDNRNIKNAKNILLGADFIWLGGGKILEQNKIMKKSGLKKFLHESFDGVIVGISAGSMNLCNMVYNFPEEVADLKNKNLVKGLGFFNEMIIPHCDGNSYLYEEEGFHSFKDYILPFSYKNDLLALPNGSYIMIDKNGYKIFGEYYILRKGIVYKKV